MQLIKCGKFDYDVIASNEVVGWLNKRHEKGSGRGYRQYVGYVTPYDQWVFTPDADEGSIYYNSFKEAKAGLAKKFA